MCRDTEALDGSWVLLHNCHLALDYVDELLSSINCV